MKVVLLKDVKKMGRAHETVEVSDGYALNYLIPNRFAQTATGGMVRTAETRKAKTVADREMRVKLLAQNLKQLKDARIVVKATANEQGHLYDAVGEEEISKAAKESAGIDLPEDAIKLERRIKELGTFEINVAAGDQEGTFSLVVEAA
jgi:large subunit ribosomal protein L9